MTLDQFLQKLHTEFRHLSTGDGEVITATDAELHEKIALAQLRTFAALQIMRADFDADGAVTADELRRLLRYERRTLQQARTPPVQRTAPAPEEQIEQEVRRLMAADLNGDGKITWDEVLQFAKNDQRVARMGDMGLANQVRQLMAFDADGDGKLTLAEFESAGEAVFRSIDANGDGIISQEELTAFRQRLARQAAEESARQREEKRREAAAAAARVVEQARAACALPKASDAAKVLLLSAYETEALSSVTIGLQDVATGTGTLHIEPGHEPLYLVAIAFRPTIWRVTGAVERVERVVIIGIMTGPDRSLNDEVPLAGATGIPAERVHIIRKSGCYRYFTEAPSTASAIVAAAVRRETGKQPALIAAKYDVGGFVLPSGEIRSAKDHDGPTVIIDKPANKLIIRGNPRVIVQEGPRNLAEDMKRFFPGGVVEIDAASVVASLPPARYEVLPSEAGLLQLLQSGALSRNQRGEFVIRQKIRFPAELSGAHAVRFLLPRGVPAPDGDAGHSCVILEETGRPMEGDC